MKNKKLATLIVIINIVVIAIIYKIVTKNTNILNKRQIIKEMTVSEYDNSITELNKSHEDYATQVQENKKKIAQAISNENVATSENATVEEMVKNIGRILQARTSDATATEDNITAGKTAYVNGELITGTSVGTSVQRITYFVLHYNEGRFIFTLDNDNATISIGWASGGTGNNTSNKVTDIKTEIIN